MTMLFDCMLYGFLVVVCGCKGSANNAARHAIMCFQSVKMSKSARYRRIWTIILIVFISLRSLRQVAKDVTRQLLGDGAGGGGGGTLDDFLAG